MKTPRPSTQRGPSSYSWNTVNNWAKGPYILTTLWFWGFFKALFCSSRKILHHPKGSLALPISQGFLLKIDQPFPGNKLFIAEQVGLAFCSRSHFVQKKKRNPSRSGSPYCPETLAANIKTLITYKPYKCVNTYSNLVWRIFELPINLNN